ncbi:peptidylprolyl isomerase [Actinocrispum sp. NPDC049592]|uniref:peptidylprolyl isomerase n=1 Tax=Actinocrispum sp. NPDC049592 TaxID=3154835 RepID=UPI00343AF996
MPSNQQRREAAKRKLERQLARRAERAKRRRIMATSFTVGAVIIVVGAIYALVHFTGNDTPAASETSTPDTPTSSAPPAPTTQGPCKYSLPADPPAAKQVPQPPDADPTPNTGTAKVLLKTTQGDIPLVLDRAKAPCTTQAIEHLVKSKYYDNTPCHRLTTGEGLKVLQCGDPSGKGNGGPGFEIKDELPKDLKPSADGQAQIYPKGTLAMANSGPNTNGSQFFMVYADSTLPPNYTIFGTIDPAGLTVLDKIAQAGVAPGQDGQPAQDGAPKNAVTIQTATES